MGLESRRALPLTYTCSPLYFLLWDMVLLNCSGCSQSCRSPASASRVVGITAPGSKLSYFILLNRLQSISSHSYNIIYLTLFHPFPSYSEICNTSFTTSTQSLSFLSNHDFHNHWPTLSGPPILHSLSESFIYSEMSRVQEQVRQRVFSKPGAL